MKYLLFTQNFNKSINKIFAKNCFINFRSLKQIFYIFQNKYLFFKQIFSDRTKLNFLIHSQICSYVLFFFLFPYC